jgi:phenylpyruvate tautomerase PptA (4-oxalocrotonate tautomerase family)
MAWLWYCNSITDPSPDKETLMAQVKIFGFRTTLDPIKYALSNAIHDCLKEAFALPEEKRFHRFIPLDAGDFIYPPDRTEEYIIIEISCFEGRSVETKKQLIRLLFERITGRLGMRVEDLEITIFETPKANWGIRGRPGDELALNYKVDV